MPKWIHGISSQGLYVTSMTQFRLGRALRGEMQAGYLRRGLQGKMRLP